MPALRTAVQTLLALGGDRWHPASAVIGAITPAGRSTAAGGWARRPAAGVDGVEMDPRFRLDVASVTKVAASTTIAMRLVAAGQLALEDPVRRYLPGFRGPGTASVTVEHLLTHTAGLRAWWPLYLETTDRDAALELVQALPLERQPGTTWRYSDLGLILVGCVIEQITSMRLGDAFRSLVAAPLGIDAGFGPIPAEQAAASSDGDACEYAMVASGDPYPVPFSADRFGGWRRDVLRGVVNDGNAAHALGGDAGHAGLFASVDDLLTIGLALRAGDLVPRRILDRFARPTPIHPEQAVGFRRSSRATPAGEVTLLHHAGFTGTCFAIGLETELVIAAGAMRLYGTFDLDGPDRRTDLVTVSQIEQVAISAGLAGLTPDADSHLQEAR